MQTIGIVLLVVIGLILIGAAVYFFFNGKKEQPDNRPLVKEEAAGTFLIRIKNSDKKITVKYSSNKLELAGKEVKGIIGGKYLPIISNGNELYIFNISDGEMYKFNGKKFVVVTADDADDDDDDDDDFE